MFGLFAGVLTTVRPGGPVPRYAGQYISHGDEAAATTWLTLLPEGDYVVVYFGGMEQGTWRTRPTGELELHEWRSTLPDFVVYARTTPGLADSVRLQFDGFDDDAAKVGLAAAGPDGVPMQPVFDNNISCYRYPYLVRRLARQVPMLHLAATRTVGRRNPASGQLPEVPLYTYPVDGRYNDYQVYYTGASTQATHLYRGQLRAGALWLARSIEGQPAGQGRAQSFGQWRALSAKAQQEARRLVADGRAPLPAESAIKTYVGDSTYNYTYYRLPGTTRPLRLASIQLSNKPLFEAGCPEATYGAAAATDTLVAP